RGGTAARRRPRVAGRISTISHERRIKWRSAETLRVKRAFSLYHAAGSTGSPRVFAWDYFEGATSMIVLILLIGVIVVVSIASLVCFIMVLVKMFQHGQTGLGVACIVLALCTGIGSLIAFIYGWVKASEWRIQPLMMVWSGCLAIGLVLGLV